MYVYKRPYRRMFLLWVLSIFIWFVLTNPNHLLSLAGRPLNITVRRWVVYKDNRQITRFYLVHCQVENKTTCFC